MKGESASSRVSPPWLRLALPPGTGHFRRPSGMRTRRLPAVESERQRRGPGTDFTIRRDTAAAKCGP